jgi:hypothetical protein
VYQRTAPGLDARHWGKLSMGRHSALERIHRLDPERDHQEITYLISCYEFPFDITRSLEFALFRTFASPRIGGLLARTGEFTQRAQKRYDDTDLILSELIEHGYDSERGRAALRRMNQIHGRFAIANEDFLYVLSTFVFEPIRWIDRYGYRPLTEPERLGLFHYWRTVGHRMNIKDIPEDLATFERYNVEYERSTFRQSEANHRVALATRDMFLSWFLPPPLRPLGAPFIHALMDDSLRQAVGFPEPPLLVRRFVHGALKVRGRVVRLLPERRRPRLRTEVRHRTYRRGYRIDDLGPATGPAGDPR